MKKALRWSLIILLPIFLLFAYMTWETYQVRVKYIPYASCDIPAAFDGYKIVFLSDIHYGLYFSAGRLKDLVVLVNSLVPDLVLIGGDYVYKDPRYIAPCFSELKNLAARDGVCGVLGNHDFWESASLTRQSMQQAGIQCLDNTALWIYRGSARIRIGGAGDFWEDTQDIAATVREVREDDLCLLVSHNPDFIDIIEPEEFGRIDLILCGHTHGGQVTVFGFYAPIVPIRNKRYWYGLNTIRNTTVYTTAGIGTVTPPFRFCDRPEVVVLILKRTTASG